MSTHIKLALALTLASASTGLVACGEEGSAGESQGQDLTLAGDDGVPTRDDGEVEMWWDGTGYFWRLVAANGEEILEGTPVLTSPVNAPEARAHILDDIRYAARAGEIDDAYRFHPADSNPDATSDGEWYFELAGFQGQLLGTSEVYDSKSNAQRGMETVMGYIGQAELDDWTDLCGHYLALSDGTFTSSFATPGGVDAVLWTDTSETEGKDRIQDALVFGVDADAYSFYYADDGVSVFFDIVTDDGEAIMTSYYVYASEDDASVAAGAILTAYTDQAGCTL